MTRPQSAFHPKHPLLLACIVPLVISTPFQARAREQVVWKPVIEKQQDQLQILVPSLDRETEKLQNIPAHMQKAPQPIDWEIVQDSSDFSTNNRSISTTVVWEPLTENSSIARDGSKQSETVIVWEVLPNTMTPLAAEKSQTIAEFEGVEQPSESSVSNEKPPSEVFEQEEAIPRQIVLELPTPPPLQSLNRSIAFGDGLVGPDIGWRVPNGFRWSRRWFGDASVQAINRRDKGDDNFFDFGDGDGEGIVHINVLQTENWSVALNHSFRSLQSNPNIAGGTTGITDGMSTGFRIARAIGDTGGIAFGAEQLIQWDDNTDTGRNIYLMATKGWWLGNQGKDYPLLIANGGFGTGAFQYDSPLRFACINNVQNRTANFQRDNDLCWAPIGTLSLIFNEYFGIFTEYNGTATTLSASLNLTGGIPLRLTWGVSFGDSKEFREEFDQYRWTFGASLGF